MKETQGEKGFDLFIDKSNQLYLNPTLEKRKGWAQHPGEQKRERFDKNSNKHNL